MPLISLDSILPAVSLGNGSFTSGSLTELPSTILETLIPGYGVISRYFSEYLGFDVTIIVSLCALTFAISTSAKYLWTLLYNFFEKYFMSSITVSSDDDMFDNIMKWLGQHGIATDSRSLIAATQQPRSWDIVTGDLEQETASEEPTGQWLNYSDSDAKLPPRFEPNFGDHWFWHNGRIFFLKRDQKSAFSSGWGGTTITDKQVVTITCIGRTTNPVKELLAEVTQRAMEKERVMTRIRRPAPKEERASRWSPWVRIATRPSRPLATVVLDYQQKLSLIHDINEYLAPETPRWYANRGIPYRRGYLFHGPPGTGKTSLSFALAGCFGLDVFVVSLLDRTLTEEDLSLLFNHLPRRCVVLLEDIDASGITHKRDDAEDGEAKDGKNKDWNLVDVAKALKSAKDDDEKDKKKGISLSGLLNAIDGVASHEGRVLVMTTNHPEKLDDALIRPGRVDLQVGFTLASQAQVRELFVRMYAMDRPKPFIPSKVQSVEDLIGTEGAEEDLEYESDSINGVANGHANGSAHAAETPRKHALSPCSLPLAEIKSIAEDFAKRIPDRAFSPAEVQGFLLTRKTDPQRALAEVEKWRDSLLENKASKTKVLAVQ